MSNSSPYWGLALGFAIVIAASTSGTSLADQPVPINWSPKIAPALNRAQAEGKWVMVEIAPDGNEEAQRMDAETLANPQLQKALTHFIQVKVTTTWTEAAKVADQLSYAGPNFPIIIILDSRGAMAENSAGFRDVAQLQKFFDDFQLRFGTFETTYEVTWNVSVKRNEAYRFVLPETEIISSPVWAPTSSSPPLAPRAAMRLAQAALDRIDPKGWCFAFLDLSPLDSSGHWIWRTVYRRNAPHDMSIDWMEWGYDSVPVLMSGFVPKPNMVRAWPNGIDKDRLDPAYTTTARIQGPMWPPLSRELGVEWILGNTNYKYYDLNFSKGEIGMSPIWNLTEDSPPLAPREAIKLAQDCLNEITPATAWNFSSVDLTPLDNSGHWIYMVNFQRNDPPDALLWDHRGTDTVPVLMNGLVPKPKLRMDSEAAKTKEASGRLPFIVEPLRSSSAPTLQFTAPPNSSK